MPDQPSLPHSREAEEAVLGSILIDAGCYPAVAEIVQAEDFYIQRNRWIWEAIASLDAQQAPVDYLTLQAELERHERLEEAGGPAYLTALIHHTPTSLHATGYAQILAEAGLRRRLLQAANQTARLACSGRMPVQQVLDTAQRLLLQAGDRGAALRAAPMRAIVSAVYDQVDTAAQSQAAFLGLPSGFQDLDRLLQGMQGGNFLVLAGRPGTGKTALALNLAVNVIQHASRCVAVYSLEMSKSEVGCRLLSLCSGIDGQRLRAGKVWESEWPAFLAAVEQLSQMPLVVDDTPSLTPLQLRARCRRMREQEGLDLVIIDYLQLMSLERRCENRQAEVSAISRQLKSLAKELDIPILAAAQLSRAVEQRGDRRPQLSDLRDSGSIEQDSDVVMFLFKDDHISGRMILEIAKHRNGPTGILPLTFTPGLTRFETPNR